ncbi:MAG: gluconate 2-dehydrogenase subunit 3 family protein [Bradymonadaceae bacterium]|nr:gluconate 2-dehydrogenase subunit 3 family protein [Lujinxingiaceae bacterium]
MIQRRTFLKLSGLGVVAMAASSLVYRVGGVWWDQTPATDHKVLSAHEALIVSAMADALFPGDALGMPNGAEAGVVAFMDEYLSVVDAQTANLLRLLLHAVDEMAVVVGIGMTRFHKRSREERLAILGAWDGSLIAVRRSAFMSLKFILASGYCEDPAVLRAAGIEFTCGGMA